MKKKQVARINGRRGCCWGQGGRKPEAVQEQTTEKEKPKLEIITRYEKGDFCTGGGKGVT